MTQTELVRLFYRAFNAQDLANFVATLHPEVELQTARGLRCGHDEAREWATKSPAGGLDQRLVVEELRERGNHVVALYRKQWWWRESEKLARDDEMAALFTFDDGLISRWQPFEDRAEAVTLLDELART
ncbi:MAG: nuclear transport factor 2 family protein [Solirubrobacterales bacterium]